MSLLPSILTPNPNKALSADGAGDDTQATRNQSWLISYIALFTALLAFFILTISLLNLETSAPKRSYANLIHGLESQLNYEIKQADISWLKVDANLTKGVRISIDKELVAGETLFKSASAQINPRYLPYLRSLLPLFSKMNTEALRQQHSKLLKNLENQGYELRFVWRIVGHTDANPMAANARFRNNVELSAFRAYAMMEWLRIRLSLPKEQFAIAGYGSFQPITENPVDAENRRIEIYLVPQLLPRIKNEIAQQQADVLLVEEIAETVLNQNNEEGL